MDQVTGFMNKIRFVDFLRSAVLPCLPPFLRTEACAARSKKCYLLSVPYPRNKGANLSFPDDPPESSWYVVYLTFETVSLRLRAPVYPPPAI